MELILSVILLVILTAGSTYLFRAVLLVWSSQAERSGIDINLDRGIEDMARDLRKAREVQSVAGRDEIRFRQGTSSHYIYYLYNAADSYGPPPAFDQPSYQLKKASLTGGISGIFTYGDGEVIVNDVVPPPTTDLSLSGNFLTVDLTADRGDETIRSRTQIRPRNV